MSDGHARTEVSAAEVMLPAGSSWRRLPAIGGAIGVLGLIASVALSRGSESGAAQFYFSYLTAFVYFVSLMLGGMFFVLVQFLTRAGWSVAVRRLAEAVGATAPLFVLLFLPLLPGLHTIYHHWMAADPGDVLLAHKAAYLNVPFFLARSAIVLLCWSVIGVYFWRASVRQDRLGDLQATRRLQSVAAPATFVFAITLTIAAMDWLMTLNPHWFSTMFGVYYFAGSVVGIFALLSVVVVSLRSSGLLQGIVTVEHDHDLGKLLFAFVVFWSYIAFSQYFLIWYAHMPEETVFYAARLHPASWRALSIVLAVGHFVVPFFFLMSRHVKRRPAALALGATWLLVMHYVDLYWLVMPTLHPEGVVFSLVDLTTLIGVGGLFLASFSWILGRRALVPLRDPRLAESLRFENT